MTIADPEYRFKRFVESSSGLTTSLLTAGALIPVASIFYFLGPNFLGLLKFSLWLMASSLPIGIWVKIHQWILSKRSSPLGSKEMTIYRTSVILHTLVFASGMIAMLVFVLLEYEIIEI